MTPTYKPVDVVLGYISSNVRKNSSDLELKFKAYNAFKTLDLYSHTEIVCCTLPIFEHEVELPDDIYKLKRFYYAEDIDENLPCEYKLQCKCGTYLCNNVEEDSCNTCGNTVEVKAFTTRTNSICQHTMHYNIYLDFLSETKPKYLGFKGNTRNMVDDSCVQSCTDYVTLKPSENKLLVPNQKDGYLHIIYLAEIKNKKGDFLIPDNIKLIRGLAAFVEAEFLKDMSFEEPKYYNLATGLYSQADKLINQYRGEKLLGSINFKEIDELVGRKTNAQNLLRNGARSYRRFI